MSELRIADIFVYVFERIELYSTDDYVHFAVKHCIDSRSDAWFAAVKYSDELFEIKRTPKGKPYFHNCSDLYVSVSHSSRYLACALAHINIGIDIEREEKYRDESTDMFSERLCKIADRFFHPAEAWWIKGDPTNRFFEIFTAKESFVKYKGTGLDETLGEISLLPRDHEMPSCHHSKEQVTWEANGAAFVQTVYDHSYTLCLCADRGTTAQLHVIYQNHKVGYR